MFFTSYELNEKTLFAIIFNSQFSPFLSGITQTLTLKTLPSLNHIIDLLLFNKDFMNDRFGIEHVYLFGYNSLNEEKNLSKINILYENNKDLGMPLGRLINLEKYIKERIKVGFSRVIL